MNKGMIVYIISLMLILEAVLMLFPALVALIYGESAGLYYLYTLIASAIIGFILRKLVKPRTKTIYAKEGLVTVALCWIVMSLVGALPFTLCGDIPNYLDAVFETVSGFSTTGSSILQDVEALNNCSLFWRSFSHWIGGMGILVFMLALVNLEGGQALYLLRAESPGPNVGKMVPKMAESSKILYSIYFALTLIQAVLYLLGGMPVFDSICNALATAGTGGFAIKSASFAAYDYYAQTVTTIFMFLFGVNFSIYFFLLRRKFDLAYKNTELRWYLIIIITSITLLSLNVYKSFPSIRDTIHHTAFTVAALITTTGFGTVDFNLWPEFSRVIIVMLMMLGACAGSTGGGFKISRAVLLFKAMRKEIRLLVHPQTVKTVTMDGKRVDNDAMRAVSCYFLFYFVISLLSVLLISLENFDASTTVTSVITTINNIGPGLGLIGPTGNFSIFSPLSKIVLILDMLYGRLELYPMLLLMLPSTWIKK